MQHFSHKTHYPVVPRQQVAGRRRSTRAQAMVEFALALPIFLLIVYGLIEAGRLIFMYASVATASREAVRYASAWGINGNGDQQYLDCVGIRNAAKQTGFLLNLQDANIVIGHDAGPSTPLIPYCSPGTTVQTSLTLHQGERVVVTVNKTVRPILPLFLPFTQQNMSSTTSRTLMGMIDLSDTPTPTAPP